MAEVSDSVSSTRTVTVRLLGRCAVLNGRGEPVKVGSRKDLALLAFLATEIAELQTRDKLAELLWSDRSQSNARHSLRQSLTVLRKVCPDGFRTVGDSIYAIPQSLGSDVAEFLRLAEGDAPDQLEEAMSLYQGPFMEGFSIPAGPFDEWQRQVRQHLTERFITVGRDLLARSVRAGELGRAITYGRRLVEADPFDEATHRDLMKALSASGRTNEALSLYKALERRLRDELDTAPDPETDACAANIGSPGAARTWQENNTHALQSGLLEAFESMDAFVIYDRNDCLVTCNEKFRSLFRDYAKLLVTGNRFEAILRAMVAGGEFPQAQGHPLKWIRYRLERHRRGENTPDLVLRDGRRMFLSQRVTRDGNIVVVFTDVTE